MTQKAYRDFDPSLPDVGAETAGVLAPERLDVEGWADSPLPSATEPSIVAVVPDADAADPGLPHWTPISQLFPAIQTAGTGVPTGSFSDATTIYAAAFVAADPIEWRGLSDGNGRDLVLVMPAGFGRASVSASVPCSVDSSGSRAIAVRLVVDGTPLTSVALTPSSNSTAGNMNTATFSATAWVFQPGRKHTVRVEVSSAQEADLAVYSKGATITVIEATTQAPNADAIALRGRSVATTAPSDGQALVWSASAGTWQPGTVSGGGGGSGAVLVTVDGDAIVAGPDVIVVGVS